MRTFRLVFLLPIVQTIAAPLPTHPGDLTGQVSASLLPREVQPEQVSHLAPRGITNPLPWVQNQWKKQVGRIQEWRNNWQRQPQTSPQVSRQSSTGASQKPGLVGQAMDQFRKVGNVFKKQKGGVTTMEPSSAQALLDRPETQLKSPPAKPKVPEIGVGTEPKVKQDPAQQGLKKTTDQDLFKNLPKEKKEKVMRCMGLLNSNFAYTRLGGDEWIINAINGWGAPVFTEQEKKLIPKAERDKMYKDWVKSQGFTEEELKNLPKEKRQHKRKSFQTCIGRERFEIQSRLARQWREAQGIESPYPERWAMDGKLGEEAAAKESEQLSIPGIGDVMKSAAGYFVPGMGRGAPSHGNTAPKRVPLAH